jgi:ArsR family transcriptional regulator, arsenate/arsenite/antimonite-responsive transcriptional repressor
MGTTKTELFSEELNKFSVIAKAIGHPARMRILQYLSKSKTCICNDIVEELGLAQPTISQHLKELKSAGLIKGTVEGKSICYCIDKKTIKQLRLFLKELTSNKQNNECC